MIRSQKNNKEEHLFAAMFRGAVRLSPIAEAAATHGNIIFHRYLLIIVMEPQEYSCGSVVSRVYMSYHKNSIMYQLIIFIIGLSMGLLIPLLFKSNDGNENQTQKDYIAALLATQWINAQWNLTTAYDSFEKNDESNAYSHLNEAVTRLYQAQSIGSIYHRLYLDSANPEHDVYVVDLPGYYLMDINEIINQPYSELQKQVLTTIVDDIRTYNKYMSSDLLSRENPSDIQNSIQHLRLELHSSHLPNDTGK
ncbi:hypothetical protein [Herpetosiphon gulosus]|uniref:Uncharacterized protein n=1 Tax=Herpetosiphon gulosus TaxID=1973496 RepID=A0ABP9X7D7_9CHLR